MTQCKSESAISAVDFGSWTYAIVSKVRLAPTIAQFTIHAPLIARKRKPGNFVIIRLSETGERIPLTIVDGDENLGTITLIVQAIGKSTKQLVRKEPGDTIQDIVGPLGNPTPIDFHGAVACVGGGVGTAELYPIARALKARGNSVYTVIGARSKDLVVLEEPMAEFSNGIFVTTDDGTYGRKGLVTDQLKDLLEAPLGIAAVYAIGPLPMMKGVSNLTKRYGVKTFVSLNAIMIDGTGMCGGCRVNVEGKMKFACVDGPEFDGHEVDFDELIMRNRTYTDLEKIADRSVESAAEEAPHGIR
jgi:ferredoxin/flavodoxin---NADP+ reductase